MKLCRSSSPLVGALRGPWDSMGLEHKVYHLSTANVSWLKGPLGPLKNEVPQVMRVIFKSSYFVLISFSFNDLKSK